METKTYTTIDREALGWPSGPWDGEPDKMQWQDTATELPCLAVRHPSCGHWCGYVGVSENHHLYGKSYTDLDVRVHGGLTYAGECSLKNSESIGICHVPASGGPDHVWWFGFDCAHAWDYSPEDIKRGYPFLPSPDQKYRTLAYVQQECKKLAAQLMKITRTVDIVTLLRRAASQEVWPAPHHEKDTLYLLAADEIEKLRAALKDLP